MALFGGDYYEEDYDPIEEYENGVRLFRLFYEDDENIPYDKPIFAPIHNEEEYDSLKEYETKLH